MKKPNLPWVIDKEKILDYKNLLDISLLLKQIDKNISLSSKIKFLDDSDIKNIEKWYRSYNMIYSYPSVERKLPKEEIKKFEKIDNSKTDFDIMNLVEISTWRLLEKFFFDNGDNVRIGKTITFDDVNSWMDYIVEFLNKSEGGETEVSDAVGGMQDKIEEALNDKKD